MKTMSRNFGLIALALVGMNVNAADQARLDAECEKAREKALGPVRVERINQCIAEKEMSKADCKREFANYDGRVGNRQLPFYDLPECERAFQNRQTNQR